MATQCKDPVSLISCRKFTACEEHPPLHFRVVTPVVLLNLNASQNVSETVVFLVAADEKYFVKAIVQGATGHCSTQSLRFLAKSLACCLSTIQHRSRWAIWKCPRLTLRTISEVADGAKAETPDMS